MHAPEHATTSFGDEARELQKRDPAPDTVVACSDLARRAMAAGDFDAGGRAKVLELFFSARIGMSEHALVVAAEALDTWPALAESPRLDANAAGHFLYLIGTGLDLALGDIDIPLTTVHEYLDAIRSIVNKLELVPLLVWELEAKVAHLEGDEATRDACVARISPVLGWRSRREHEGSCPGCVLLAFARYLPEDTPPETIEALFEPMRGKRSFPADAHGAPSAGEDACVDFELYAAARLTDACVSAGRIAEAKVHARRARSELEPHDVSRRCWVELLELEVAVAGRDRSAIERLVDSVSRNADEADSPYTSLPRVLALHAAYGILRREERLSSLRAEALALASSVSPRRRLGNRGAIPKPQEDHVLTSGTTAPRGETKRRRQRSIHPQREQPTHHGAVGRAKPRVRSPRRPSPLRPLVDHAQALLVDRAGASLQRRPPRAPSAQSKSRPGSLVHWFY